MKIKNHKLYHNNDQQVPFYKTPNCGGQYKELKYLIFHFTAGPSLQGAINTLCNPTRKASAHLIIDRDGSVVQLVPFNIKSWHAGTSKWKDLEGLNSYSIGIELVNFGPLTKNQNGQWISWTNKVIPNDQVIVAKHKNENRSRGWQTYTEEQVNTLLDVSEVLIDKYKIDDVLGHDDIAPGRKSDPSPALNLEFLKSKLFGRRD